MIALILAAAMFALVFSFWAHRNDNLAALEALDDEPLAADAAQAWKEGKW